MKNLTETFVSLLKDHLQSCFRIIPGTTANVPRMDEQTSFQVVLLAFHYEQTKMKKESINRQLLIQTLSNGTEIKYQYLRNKCSELGKSWENLKWRVGGWTVYAEKKNRLVKKHRFEEQPSKLTFDSNSIDNPFDKSMKTKTTSLVDRRFRKA